MNERSGTKCEVPIYEVLYLILFLTLIEVMTNSFLGFHFVQALGMSVVKRVDRPEYKVRFMIISVMFS